jgi:hypothetical protein
MKSLPGKNNIRHEALARAGSQPGLYFSVAIVALTFWATGAGSGA